MIYISEIKDKIIEDKLKEAGIDNLEKADKLMLGMLNKLSDKKLLKAYDIFKKKYAKNPSEENEHIVNFFENVMRERKLGEHVK